MRINLQLSRINRPSQIWVVLARVLAIAVALGVVDVLRGEVHAETLGRDFEFVGSVSVCL